MDKKQETMSNWSCVTQFLENEQPITLGSYFSSLMHRKPRRLLDCLSYYKFAAKMIGSSKRVLDIECNEGLGSWLLAKECGFCCGIDADSAAIDVACKNFHDPSVQFISADFFEMAPQLFDAIVSFDLVEHFYPHQAQLFFQRVTESLSEHGVALFGTSSEISHQMGVHKKPNNLYTHQRFYAELSACFDHVFLFSASDEVVHTGFSPLALYYIALCCKPKRVR